MNATLIRSNTKRALPEGPIVFWFAAIVALTVFSIDAFTSLDIAVAVFYVVVVLLVASSGSDLAVMGATVIVAMLTLAGFLISHDSDYAGGAIARCVLSLLAIGSTSILSLRNLSNTARLLEQIDMLNLTHDAVLVVDLEGRVTFWNHGAESLYGWSAEQALGQRIHELTQTRAALPLDEIHAKLLDSGSWSGELQRVRRDGRTVTVMSRVAVWRDAKGAPRAILATNNDITLQKRMANEIEAQQAELRAAIDTIPGMVWSASGDGDVVYVNRRWQESGVDTEGRGADLWDAVVHPDDLGAMRRDWLDALRSGSALDNMSRVRQRDGGYRWMHIAAEPLRDADCAVRRWYGVNTDVEARKRAEDALTRSEAFLVDAQRLSKTGSIGIEAVHGKMIWSAEAYRIFGYEPSPALTPGLALILERTHPEDRRQVEIAHGAAMATPLVDLKYRLIMPDGELKYVHYVAHSGPPLSTDLNYVGALMDVTSSQRTQEALTRSMAELAHATRMTTLGEMAASMAHEVTQPMAAVITSGDAALRWLGRPEPDIGEVSRSIGQMIHSARRANDIVRQIRAMARKRPSALSRVSLVEMVEEAVSMMAPELVRHGVICEVQPPPDAIHVHADSVQIQQVVVNLLLNAAQAMADLPGKPHRIVISISAPREGSVDLRIEDSGNGVPEDVRERLFTPFFTTKTNGMGMGLSICRSIIEAHGGRITLEDSLAAGARFLITLPLDAEKKENNP
ncbi:PAS domain S-box protein [Paraburkholderia tropica]|uniref:histidine kinase n=4 Tax=Paraburkholderia tropica TaxID=92647 RepID=A0ABX5MGC1_9BURK|nr:PAS domain S-box protein [Paraburkholderia tropica]PXX09633.1 PAS/PAC sensor signal transduction histidine kinase [Paraburkholderia tropica]PZW74693.1 PAS/PAC sensor signal transduction histidine kinase [Paraburkholderia tropica]QNB16922.1 PAS domain S-box protein [Paraburkholderia tropica]